MHVTLKVLEGWLSKQYCKDGWRMRSWTSEDYLQEGMAQYLNIERHYHNITEPKHLMALFKTTWFNHVHDKSRLEKEPCLGEEAFAFLEAEPEISYTDVLQRGSRLSSDAQALLTLFTAPSEIVDICLDGIVLTHRKAKVIANYLHTTPSAVRIAIVELLQEFSMPTPIQVLGTATGIKVNVGEARQAFLIRLVEEVVKLPEDAWNKLPRAAQDWYNKAAAAMNDGQPVEDIEDEVSKPAPISEARKARDEARNKARETAAAQPADKPPLPALALAPKAAAEPAKEVPVVVSPTQRAREIMTLNLLITPVEVRDQLKAEGLALPAMSALQAMRSDIRLVLRVLEKHGRLKEA